jgi:hypothetical protein
MRDNREVKKVIFFMTAFVLALVPATAFALDNTQRAMVTSGCIGARSSLQRLEVSDTLLRNNLGQEYESINSRLMLRYNSRAAAANLDITMLAQIKAKYASTLATFRQDFIAYDQALTATIAIDCTAQPEQFYTAVTDLRAKRTALHTDTVQLNQFIADYGSAVDVFAKGMN